jgi:osmotically-inducible protein OsmY
MTANHADTWITEAIADKLARERNNDAPRRKACCGYV